MQATSFLSSISKKLADHWVANLFTPAFIFWGGGGVVLLQGWGYDRRLVDNFKAAPESLQVALLIGILIIIAMSGFAVQQLDWITLRWLEGYWPRLLRPIRRWMLNKQGKALLAKERRWQDLKKKESSEILSVDEAEDLAQAEWQLSQVPGTPAQRMPTKLGNILRAAELDAYKKYGLNSVLCWPRLWLLLPDTARTDISVAREELSTATQIWLWSHLFCLWAVTAIVAPAGYRLLWPIPIGLLSAHISYQWALKAGTNYASLLRSTYDLYRFSLYEALRMHTPENLEEEIRMAAKLNQFLLRGE